MNLTFRQTADPHSLDVLHRGERVASLHWHPDRAPRMVVDKAIEVFTLAELVVMTERLKEEVQKARR